MNLTTFQIKSERINILQNKLKRYHIVYLFIYLFFAKKNRLKIQKKNVFLFETVVFYF